MFAGRSFIQSPPLIANGHCLPACLRAGAMYFPIQQSAVVAVRNNTSAANGTSSFNNTSPSNGTNPAAATGDNIFVFVGNPHNVTVPGSGSASVLVSISVALSVAPSTPPAIVEFDVDVCVEQGNTAGIQASDSFLTARWKGDDSISISQTVSATRTVKLFKGSPARVGLCLRRHEAKSTASLLGEGSVQGWAIVVA